jgi:predicted LPLAT superfamily acyltransferase
LADVDDRVGARQDPAQDLRLTPGGALVKSTPVNWRSVPEVGTMLGLRLVAGTLRLFGRRAAAVLLWFVCWYFLAFSRASRRASADLFAHLKQPPQLHRHLWNFARVAADRLLFLTGETKGLQVHLHGHEHVMALAASKRGGLLLGAHLGSFEAMRSLAARYDVPLLVVADFRNARRINALLERFSPELRVRLLELDPEAPTGLLAAKDAIDRGELVAVLADRATHRDARDLTVPFLGSPARFPAGAHVLAALLGCPVFFVCALFEAPGTYDVYCVPLTERVELPRKDRAGALQREVERYAAVLEDFVRRSPLNWFNFFPFWVEP